MSNKKYKYDGNYYTLTELQKIAKDDFNNELNLDTLYRRLNRSNWPIEKVLKSVKSTEKKYEYNGKFYTKKQLIEIANKKYNSNINTTIFNDRYITSKWSLDDTLKLPKHKWHSPKRLYEYNGKKYSISELQKVALEKFGNSLSRQQLFTRLSKSNWNMEDILKIKPRPKSKGIYEYNGNEYKLSELQKVAKDKFNNYISLSKLSYRLYMFNKNKKWLSIEEVLKTK